MLQQTNTEKNDNRLSYLDRIRVFATVAVIALHSFYTYFNDSEHFGRALWYVIGYANELARTAVPLFFMISGYLTLSRDITDIPGFYKRRFLKVGVPFLVYDVFYYFISSANVSVTPSVKGYITGLLNSGNKYHLWFVYSILFFYLLAPFLRRMVASCNEKQLLLLLAFATFQTTLRPALNLVLSHLDVRLYLANDGFTGYIGYALLGYVLGTYCNNARFRRGVGIAALVTFALVPYVTMQSMLAGEDAFFTGGYTVNHYVEAAAIFLYFKTHVHRENRAFSVLSQVSFSAYLVHPFVLETIRRLSLDLSPWRMISFHIVTVTAVSFAWGLVVRLLRDTTVGLLGLTPKAAPPRQDDARLR